MKKYFLIIFVSVMLPMQVQADAYCTVTDFEVEVYNHGGAYLHGNVGGHLRSWIKLCGGTNNVADCTTNTTDQRVSMAMTAFAMGKDLRMYFHQNNSGTIVNSCADVTNYSLPLGIKIVK